MRIAIIVIFGMMFYAAMMITARRYFISRLRFAKNKDVFAMRPSINPANALRQFLLLKYLRCLKGNRLMMNYMLFLLDIILGFCLLVAWIFAVIYDLTWLWELSETFFLIYGFFYTISIIYISRHPPYRRNR